MSAFPYTTRLKDVDLLNEYGRDDLLKRIGEAHLMWIEHSPILDYRLIIEAATRCVEEHKAIYRVDEPLYIVDLLEEVIKAAQDSDQVSLIRKLAMLLGEDERCFEIILSAGWAHK